MGFIRAGFLAGHLDTGQRPILSQHLFEHFSSDGSHLVVSTRGALLSLGDPGVLPLRTNETGPLEPAERRIHRATG